MKGETFIMAPEALKLGLIDEIVNLWYTINII
jgi:ATP-dependent protease ClpP protease subunit